MDILKYFVEERKISEVVKVSCVDNAARYGRLDCLKYLVEEAKAPLNDWRYIASLVTTSTPTAKTTCSKKGAQNQRTKNTLNLSKAREETAVEHQEQRWKELSHTHIHFFNTNE